MNANNNRTRKRSSHAQTKSKITASVTDLTKSDEYVGYDLFDSGYAHNDESWDSYAPTGRRYQNIEQPRAPTNDVAHTVSSSGSMLLLKMNKQNRWTRL